MKRHERIVGLDWSWASLITNYFQSFSNWTAQISFQKTQTIKGTHVLHCFSSKCFSFSQLFDCRCSFCCRGYDDLRLLVWKWHWSWEHQKYFLHFPSYSHLLFDLGHFGKFEIIFLLEKRWTTLILYQGIFYVIFMPCVMYFSPLPQRGISVIIFNARLNLQLLIYFLSVVCKYIT